MTYSSYLLSVFLAPSSQMDLSRMRILSKLSLRFSALVENRRLMAEAVILMFAEKADAAGGGNLNHGKTSNPAVAGSV